MNNVYTNLTTLDTVLLSVYNSPLLDIVLSPIQNVLLSCTLARCVDIGCYFELSLAIRETFFVSSHDIVGMKWGSDNRIIKPSPHGTYESESSYEIDRPDRHKIAQAN